MTREQRKAVSHRVVRWTHETKLGHNDNSEEHLTQVNTIKYIAIKENLSYSSQQNSWTEVKFHPYLLINAFFKKSSVFKGMMMTDEAAAVVRDIISKYLKKFLINTINKQNCEIV